MAPLSRRIDVHSHFLPPFYRKALAENGHLHPDGMPAIPEWSLERHLDMMSTANVSKSMLSVSSPGTHITPGNDTLGRYLTRQCNAYAAELKREYPEKFGFWAALPLPDVDAALEEIETAIGEGADGFGLMTNYHGNYLGSPALDGVFDKLNEVGATIFIHPTKPCIKHGNETSSAQTTDALPFGSQYPIPIFEFFFDTARAVINLFSSGTVDRCPNIKFIIPHSGGALPPMMTRFIQFSSVVPGGRVLDAETVRKQLDEQFYFDLAGFVFDGESGGNGQLKAFVEGFEISYERLLYGSDFPFTQTQFVKIFADRMKDGLEHLFSEKERGAIYEGNAVKLLNERRGEAKIAI
ncbi:amidohydrolase 2 [Cucurbitaria berberidis CBS 394.84]|uniref:6-methylsalicylate decarboxylase n=1 Tax=Cucurbitaria berberidis CBS 394.84 TaxID=1168544 RepID=A0A9P4GM75_9PLEO|nr:amidohydrolase 2 [Cucurbitaria berberidis CBS 394.84]KAF1847891.1 amidohydrolase 2 [Cucurbitaria berberidis CBS 394.84]